jgi:general secretion pathway protein G
LKEQWIHFGISLATAIVVSAIVIVTAWRVPGSQINLRMDQLMTQIKLRRIDAAINRFEEKHGAPPASLKDLLTDPPQEVDFNGEDGWRRPYIWQNVGQRIIVTSYGMDGKPGGTGLDHDLTNLDPVPHDCSPTLWQFLFEMKESRKMVMGMVGCGVLAFLTAFLLIGKADLSRAGLGTLMAKLVITGAAMVVLGWFMAFLEIPAGH